MGLHFHTRFWEQIDEPCFGGQTQTDLRVRWIVYPSNDLRSKGSGCLIVYNGMTDALRWSWMQREERLKLVLEDLDRFFSKQGVNIYEQYIDAFDVNWPSEVGGGNTMYLAGQFTRFHEAMKKPEGNVYFAGEHMSRHHTWVAGAVETAHQAVQQMLGDYKLPALGSYGPPSEVYQTAPVVLGLKAARGVAIDFGMSGVHMSDDLVSAQSAVHEVDDAKSHKDLDSKAASHMKLDEIGVPTRIRAGLQV